MSESDAVIKLVSKEEFLPQLQKVDPNAAARLDELERVVDDRGSTAAPLSTFEMYQMINPEAIEEQAIIYNQGEQQILGLLEWMRNVLILVPVAFTWIGLSRAAINYNEAIEAEAGLRAEPFILLWEDRFAGHAIPHWSDIFSDTFSKLALWDFYVLVGLIALTLIIHFWKDVVTANAEKKAALLRSQIEQFLWQLGWQSNSRKGLSDVPTSLSVLAEALNTLPNQLREMMRLFKGEQERLAKLADKQEAQAKQLNEFGKSLESFVEESRALKTVYNQFKEQVVVLGEQTEETGKQQEDIVKKLQGVGRILNDVVGQTQAVGRQIEHGMDGLAVALSQQTNHTEAVVGVTQRVGDFTDYILQREGAILDMLAETDRALASVNGRLQNTTDAINIEINRSHEISDRIDKRLRDLTSVVRSKQVQEQRPFWFIVAGLVILVSLVSILIYLVV